MKVNRTGVIRCIIRCGAYIAIPHHPTGETAMDRVKPINVGVLACLSSFFKGKRDP